jgi:hypothetical protein
MSDPKLMLKYEAQAQRMAMQAKDQDTREALLVHAERFRNLAKMGSSPILSRGKTPPMPNNSKPAWQTVMEMLERLPEHRRLQSLAYWEQKAKETGDLEILRGIKEVRRRLEKA